MGEMTRVTKDDIKAAVEIAAAVGQAIKELTELNGGVPSGHLYARLMDKLSLEQYNRVIEVLRRHQLIKINNHWIEWIGR